MKLSEAIRLGSLLREQHFGAPYSPDGKGSCALGAAADAIGMTSIGASGCWPFLVEQDAVCPYCNDRNSTAFVIATHLNDTHRWTRQQIADWVASIEPSEEQAEISGQGPRIASLEAVTS